MRKRTGDLAIGYDVVRGAVNSWVVVSLAIGVLLCAISTTSTPLDAQPANGQQVGGDAVQIGLDALHGFDSGDVLADGSDFNQLRALWNELGLVPTPLTRFEASDLAGLDGVFLKLDSGQEIFPLSQQEIDDLQSFVAGGGLLLALAEGAGESNIESFNELTGFFGVTYSIQPTEADGHDVFAFESHAVTDGLGVIGVDYQRRIVEFAKPAVDLTTLGEADDVLALVEGSGAAGNVVFASDASIWADDDSGAQRTLSFGDNEQLMRNIVAFLVPDPLLFAVDGDCPGTFALEVRGATPGATLGILSSPTQGSEELTLQPCAGLQTGLETPSPLNRLTADSSGNVQREITTDGGFCGVFLQVVDFSSCSISDVVQLPGS